MIEVEGAHRLSPAEREVLRLRVVVAALEAGKVEGYRQAAEVFGSANARWAPGGAPTVGPVAASIQWQRSS